MVSKDFITDTLFLSSEYSSTEHFISEVMIPENVGYLETMKDKERLISSPDFSSPNLLSQPLKPSNSPWTLLEEDL